MRQIISQALLHTCIRALLPKTNMVCSLYYHYHINLEISTRAQKHHYLTLLHHEKPNLNLPRLLHSLQEIQPWAKFLNHHYFKFHIMKIKVDCITSTKASTSATGISNLRKNSQTKLLRDFRLRRTKKLQGLSNRSFGITPSILAHAARTSHSHANLYSLPSEYQQSSTTSTNSARDPLDTISPPPVQPVARAKHCGHAAEIYPLRSWKSNSRAHVRRTFESILRDNAIVFLYAATLSISHATPPSGSSMPLVEQHYHSGQTTTTTTTTTACRESHLLAGTPQTHTNLAPENPTFEHPYEGLSN